MKLIVENAMNTVLGPHLVGPEMAETIQGLAVEVKMGVRKT